MSVTPLSKYVAMVLFIFMPFVGGWVGYVYSPTKVVEVERFLSVERTTPATAPRNTEVQMESRDTGWLHYINRDGGYSIEYPSEWQYETRGSGVVFKLPHFDYSEAGYQHETDAETVALIDIEERIPGETIEEWYVRTTKREADFGIYPTSSVWKNAITYEQTLDNGEMFTRYAMVFKNDKVLLMSLKKTLEEEGPDFGSMPRLLRTPPADMAAYITDIFSVGETLFATYNQVLFRAPNPSCFGIAGYCIEDADTLLVTSPVRPSARLLLSHECGSDYSETIPVVDALGVQSRCSQAFSVQHVDARTVYWLRFDDEGYVTALIEQYVP